MSAERLVPVLDGLSWTDSKVFSGTVDYISRRFRAVAHFGENGVDHWLLDCVELSVVHGGGREAESKAGQPRCPVGHSGFVSGHRCFYAPSGKAFAFSKTFTKVFVLVPLWGGPNAEGPMCLRCVTVVDCVLCLGCSRSEFDFVLFHVGGQFQMWCPVGVKFIE
jgi:hypothetical protein